MTAVSVQHQGGEWQSVHAIRLQANGTRAKAQRPCGEHEVALLKDAALQRRRVA